MNISFQLILIRSAIAGSYNKSTFNFVRNCQTVFQKVAVAFCISTTINESSCCSTSFSALGANSVSRFDDGHSDRCEMISHCSFDLHFSND